jgi:hypothetical protein
MLKVSHHEADHPGKLFIERCPGFLLLAEVPEEMAPLDGSH